MFFRCNHSFTLFQDQELTDAHIEASLLNCNATPDISQIPQEKNSMMENMGYDGPDRDGMQPPVMAKDNMENMGYDGPEQDLHNQVCTSLKNWDFSA